jgi:hypothetical protein
MKKVVNYLLPTIIACTAAGSLHAKAESIPRFYVSASSWNESCQAAEREMIAIADHRCGGEARSNQVSATDCSHGRVSVPGWGPAYDDVYTATAQFSCR